MMLVLKNIKDDCWQKSQAREIPSNSDEYELDDRTDSSPPQALSSHDFMFMNDNDTTLADSLGKLFDHN